MTTTTLPTGSSYSPLIAHLVADLTGRTDSERFAFGPGVVVESATVYAFGPVDRSMVLAHDDGRTELFSRDGRWSDSLGLDATASDDSSLDRCWQAVTGHRD
jgi:hypothetical protein